MKLSTFLFQYGNTPLHYSVESGLLDIVQLLLEKKDIDLKKVNKVCYDVLNRNLIVCGTA